MILAPEDNPDVVVRPFKSNGQKPHADDDRLGSLEHPAPTVLPLPCIAVSTFAGRPTPTKPWLVRDLIPDRTVTLLSGDGGVGKSLVAMQLGVATATGADWIGSLPEAGPVLYISAEDDEDEIHRRLSDIVAATGAKLEDLHAFHLVPLAGKDAVLAAPAGKSEIVAATPLWQAVTSKVEELRPRLLILDNLADVFAGNENSRPQARQFVGLLRGLAITHNLAVLLLGHPSLTGLSSGTGTSGSTAWNNSVRSRLYLDRVKADDGIEPDPELRVLRMMKSNYGAIGAEIRMRWDRGRFKLAGGGAGTFDRMAAEQHAERVFLDLLRLFRGQGRDVSTRKASTYAPAVFASHPDAAGITSRAFAAAMERLFAANRISIETTGPASKKRERIVVSD